MEYRRSIHTIDDSTEDVPMQEATDKELLRDDEIELCVRTVAALGLDQSDEIKASLAWMIRNRAETLRSRCGDKSVVKACNAVLKEALARNNPSKLRRKLSHREWRRLKSANQLVWQGKVCDSTNGAIACHRHDRNPRWARQRTPTALLGEFLFFR